MAAARIGDFPVSKVFRDSGQAFTEVKADLRWAVPSIRCLGGQKACTFSSLATARGGSGARMRLRLWRKPKGRSGRGSGRLGTDLPRVELSGGPGGRS